MSASETLMRPSSGWLISRISNTAEDTENAQTSNMARTDVLSLQAENALQNDSGRWLFSKPVGSGGLEEFGDGHSKNRTLHLASPNV
jgi:hypothetical protein